MTEHLYEHERAAVLAAIDYMRRRRGYISIFTVGGRGQCIHLGAPGDFLVGKAVPLEIFGVLNRNAEMVRQILGDEGLHTPDLDPELN